MVGEPASCPSKLEPGEGSGLSLNDIDPMNEGIGYIWEMGLTYEDKLNVVPEGALVAEVLPGKESEMAGVPCWVLDEESGDVDFEAGEGDDVVAACEF